MGKSNLERHEERAAYSLSTKQEEYEQKERVLPIESSLKKAGKGNREGKGNIGYF